jgi:hypothetical protein
MLDQIMAVQEEIDAKRAVVDGTTSIGFHLQDPAKIRIELLKMRLPTLKGWVSSNVSKK